jgi:transposase
MSTDSESPSTSRVDYAFLIGIDWASNKHDVFVVDSHGKHVRPERLEHSTEAIEAWVAGWLTKANGKPIAIAIEQSKGSLVYSLMHRENVDLFPINPQQLASFRQSFTNANIKEDSWEAQLTARFLFERRRELRKWIPDDDATRRINLLAQARRETVDERTRLGQRMLELLRLFHPAILLITKNKVYDSAALLAVVAKWADPSVLKRVHPRTLKAVLKEHGACREKLDSLVEGLRSAPLHCRDQVINHTHAMKAELLAKELQLLNKAIKQYDEELDKAVKAHPDSDLYKPIGGAGTALVPRIIAALGSDRDRFTNAEELTNYVGTSPVCRQSGKSKQVSRRWACNKYLMQTFHELAASTAHWTRWAAAYYKYNQARGMKRHAILRKLARCWLRIIFRVWKNRTPYDDARYEASLLLKTPELRKFMSPA